MGFLRPNDTILFQGDSITNAFRMPGEINDAYQLGAGYAMMIAAQLRRSRCDDNITFINRGVSGNRVDDLRARWHEDCLRLKPDVLSILVGVNDTLNEDLFDEGKFRQSYAELIDSTRRDLPDCRIILCEPFLLPVESVSERKLLNVQSCAKVVRELSREKACGFVPFGAAFKEVERDPSPEYWAYDGIHPTAAGHALLCETWLQWVSRQVAFIALNVREQVQADRA